MLDQIARHGLIDLDIVATGDLHIDAHHTVEDLGITLGQAFAKGPLATRKACAAMAMPMCRWTRPVAGGLDLSGRPGLVFDVTFTRGMIGDFDVDLFHEFFQGFVNHAGVTLHVDNLRGQQCTPPGRTVFKAFGRALRMAIEPDQRLAT